MDPDPGSAKTFNNFYGEKAKFLLNIQGFEYLRRFFGRQRKSTKFFFPKKAKKFRNYDFLSRFGQDPDPLFVLESDPYPDLDPGRNPQNFSFQKKLKNFETLNFCQDSTRIRIRIRDPYP